MESKKESVLEDIENIVHQLTDDLNLERITDPNEPWGPCNKVKDDYKNRTLILSGVNGVYAVELTQMSIIKIIIRLNPDYMEENESLVEDCLEEVEDRLKDGYDYEKRPIRDGQINHIEYDVYVGKWSHSKDEWGASYNRFISD